MEKAGRFVSGLVNIVLTALTLVIVAAVGYYVFTHRNTVVTCLVNDQPVNGCQVQINGAKVGTTPLKQALGPGSFEIVVTPPNGVLTDELNRRHLLVTAMTGAQFAASFTSVETVSTVSCTLDGQPLKDCDIELDRRFVGQTPFQRALPAGKHTLTVFSPPDVDTREGLWDFDYTSDGQGQQFVAKFTRQ